MSGGQPGKGTGGLAGAPAEAGSGGLGEADGIGVFVGAGYGARRIRSIDDGVTWVDDQNSIPDGEDDEWLLRDIGFGGGVFVAAGYRVMTSTDGKEWTSTERQEDWIGGLAYGEGKWVAAGSNSYRAISSDGLDFERPPNLTGEEQRHVRGLTYESVSGRWIAIADDAVVYTTADGSTWTRGEGADFTGGPVTVAAGGGIVVAVMRGEISRSIDGGVTWEPARDFDGISDLAYADGGFVGIGRDRAMTSSDGVDWESSELDGLEGAVACHATTCVALAPSRAFRSTDAGKTWKSGQALSEDSQYIAAVSWGRIAASP
jgi:hypothetical protein